MTFRYDEIGNRLKAYRLGSNLSADEIANQLGISRTALYRFEKGELAKIETLERLAELLGVSIPTQRIIRQDPLEEFACALGCRVDEMLLAGESSQRNLLATEFDLEEVTTAIGARRPPLEESILQVQRVAVVPLSVLGTARQLVGKISGRLAKLVIESTIAAWHRDAALAS